MCSNVYAYCRNGGEWVCNYPETYEPEETRCDGLDNDCDGLVDEEIFDGFCYTGPIGTELYFPCHPGVMICQAGTIACINEQHPIEEACNRIDDDCDGVIDNTGNGIDIKYDIVFVIDRSGSMCNEIDQVAIALEVYIRQFAGDDNYRFAIVDMTFEYGDFVEVILDFTDLGTVQATLLAMACNGTGSEASLDAMYEVCLHNTSVELDLSWRDDANAAQMVFTDEHPQTYTAIPTDSLMVTDACLANGVVPFVWGPYGIYALGPNGDFTFVRNAGGEVFDLIPDWQVILDDLNSVLISLCGGGQ